MTTKMTIQEIEQKGYAAVIAYEAKRGRRATVVTGKGYDALSKAKGDERHIEVKARAKPTLHFVMLRQREFDAMRKDKKFYLYVVTNVAREPMVKEYAKDDVLKRFGGVDVQFRIAFGKDDFKAS